MNSGTTLLLCMYFECVSIGLMMSLGTKRFALCARLLVISCLGVQVKAVDGDEARNKAAAN